MRICFSAGMPPCLKEMKASARAEQEWEGRLLKSSPHDPGRQEEPVKENLRLSWL